MSKNYTRCLSPLLSLEKFRSFGGLDNGFYGSKQIILSANPTGVTEDKQVN